MKKIVGIIAAAALAGAAFAEVNIGLSANQAFAPIAYDGDDIVTVGPDANWNGVNSSNHLGRIGISFSAESENAGVVTDIHNEDGSHDNAYGWVKPFDFLKISAGKLDGPWHRLGFGYGAWAYTLRPYGIDSVGDDLAFWKPHAPNFQVLLTPVEGLEIVWDYEADGGDVEIYDELWNHARFGVSYEIADVGMILAQVYGNDPYTNKDGDKVKASGTANVAFHLTGVENLDAQFGVKAPLTFDPYTKSPIVFGAGAHYGLDALTIHGFFQGALVPTADGTELKYKDFGFAIGAGVDFAINDSWTLIADIRYNNKEYNSSADIGGTDYSVDKKGNVKQYVAPTSVDATDHFLFFAGVAHHLTNATIKTGITGSTNSVINNNLTDSGKFQDFTFAVPVVLDISL